MDRPDPKGPNPLAGLSVRNGPVVEDNSMDLDLPTNGTSKRKSRGSLPKISYKDESDSEKEPLVSRYIASVANFTSADLQHRQNAPSARFLTPILTTSP